MLFYALEAILMTLDTLLLFTISIFLISATPGPNMLLSFQFGINYGVKRTLLLIFGQLFGLFLLLLIAIFIITGIAKISPRLFTGFELAGACYLIYLGIQGWRHAQDAFRERKTKTPNVPWLIFRRGLLCSLSNPKAILVFSAFLPKFINPALPLLPQYLLIIAIQFPIEFAWGFTYAYGGRSLATWLNRGNRIANLNRLCGSIFILIALAIIYDAFSAS